MDLDDTMKWLRQASEACESFAKTADLVFRPFGWRAELSCFLIIYRA